LGAGLAIFLVVVRAIKKKRDRRKQSCGVGCFKIQFSELNDGMRNGAPAEN